MNGLKVLIVNTTLATRTGTETYVRDIAIGLLRRGHQPVVYAPELGPIATELRRNNVVVVDHLGQLAVPPDIIHGNHNAEVITALLRFPSTPAVFVCHSVTDSNAAPPVHPRIFSYIAVDDACRDRLLSETIPEERVRVSLHGPDLDRFKPRNPLPERPQRALVFSNNANEWTHLAAVRNACAHAQIELDVVGAGVNATSLKPESILGKYDLVFAKARCALEALTVGTAVILCDARGSGPLVTPGNYERLRRLNFGIRALSENNQTEVLLRQIEQYNAHDAAEVSRLVRNGRDLNVVVNELIQSYEEVRAEFRERSTDPAEENRAAADYLRWLTLTTRQKQADLESMLAESLVLRIRNKLSRLPLVDKILTPLAHIARRNGV